MAKKRKVDVDLTDTSKTHLVCRDLHHAWEWQTDLLPNRDEDRRITSVTRVLSCLRCGTNRRDEYTVPSFTRMKSTYEYPEGYVTHQGGHVPVAVVRAEVYRRMTSKKWRD